MTVCFQIDDFIMDKPMWIVELSNNQKVYQDDYRVEPYNSWLRLKEYVLNNNLKVKSIGLRFRSINTTPVPPEADGYFFIQGLANYNLQITVQNYIFGWIDNNNCKISKWTVPDLQLMGFEDRDWLQYKKLIIWNNPNVQANYEQFKIQN